MNISSFFDVFNNYGWSGIAAIFVIILLYIGVLYANKKLSSSIGKDFKDFSEDLTDTITKQNDKLLDGIQEQNKLMLTHIISGSKQEHDTKIEQRLNIEEDINNKLREMMHSYHANRAAIIEFHNSKENIDGLSFCWYDIHYEKFSKGTDDIIMKVQNQPSSILSPIGKRLKKADYVLLSNKDLEEMFDEACSLYNQLHKIPNLEYVLYYGIYNADNRLVGLVVLEWHYKFDIHLLDNYYQEIKNSVSYISSLLILHNKQENKEKINNK